VISRPVW